MTTAKSPKAEFPEEEIAKRRDEGLRRLKMPPKSHAGIVGQKGPKHKSDYKHGTTGNRKDDC